MEQQQPPPRPHLNRLSRLKRHKELPSPAQMWEEIMRLQSEVERLRGELEKARLALPGEVAAQVRAMLDAELAPARRGTPIALATFGALDWPGKVTAILLEAGLPLRKRDILARLEALLPGIAAQYSNLSGTLSTHLHSLSTNGRIIAMRPFGRGVCYALLEWVDDEGNLDREMLAALAGERARP